MNESRSSESSGATPKDERGAKAGRESAEEKHRDNEKKKDWWDKGDIIVKALLTFAGIWFTLNFNANQERNRQAQAATTLMAQREQNDMDFRQKMFSSAFEALLKDTVGFRTKLTRLQLLQDNFQAEFNARALFDELASQAAGRGKAELISELISMARHASDMQTALVMASVPESEAGVDTLMVERTVGKGDSVIVQVRCKAEPHRHPHHEHDVKINIFSIPDTTEAKVKLTVDGARFNHGHPFGVTYFDMPFTDNTLLPDGHRIALILEDIPAARDSATLRVIEFPAEYVLSGYRPSLARMNDLLEDRREGAVDRVRNWLADLIPHGH
jgi:hypothetical protein